MANVTGKSFVASRPYFTAFINRRHSPGQEPADPFLSCLPVSHTHASWRVIRRAGERRLVTRAWLRIAHGRSFRGVRGEAEFLIEKVFPAFPSATRMRSGNSEKQWPWEKMFSSFELYSRWAKNIFYIVTRFEKILRWTRLKKFTFVTSIHSLSLFRSISQIFLSTLLETSNQAGILELHCSLSEWHFCSSYSNLLTCSKETNITLVETSDYIILRR